MNTKRFYPIKPLLSILSCLMLFLFSCPVSGMNIGDSHPPIPDYDSRHSSDSIESPETAIILAYKKLEIANQSSDKNMQIEGYIDLGYGFKRIGKYDFALQNAYRAFHLLESSGTEAQRAAANRLTGTVYSELDIPEQAIDFLQKAFDHYYQSKDTLRTIRVLGEIAIAHGRMKNYEKCLSLFEQIYDYTDKLHFYPVKLATMLNMAKVFHNTGESDRGLNMLERIRWEIPADFFTDSYRIPFLLYRGQLLRQAGKLQEAEADLQTGLELTDLLNDQRYKIDILSQLLFISETKNDCLNILRYYDQLRRSEDSANYAIQKKRIEAMNVIHNMTDMEAELERIRHRAALSRIFYIFIFSAFIGLACYFFFRWKKNIRNKEKEADLLEDELQKKRESLTRMAIYFHEVKHTVEQAASMLKGLQADLHSETEKKALQKSHTRLNQIISGNADTLGIVIDEQYSDFLSRLAVRYPELTTTERRICAMLTIGFSSKEMALMLNCSAGTLDNIRSRIREKLGISKGESIQQGLKSI